jgi:integral membrane protein
VAPLPLFRRAALAEVVTWALLLLGMFLKYVTETTDLAVTVFGMLHGVVFLAFCLVAVLVAVDARWPVGRLVLALASAVPPFATVPFERRAVRLGHLPAAWRLRSAEPSGAVERLVAWVVRAPLRGALVGVLAVAVLTAAALLVGPPPKP